MEQCGKSASEDQEEEDEEGFWTNGEKRQDSSTLRRCVSSRKMRWSGIAMVSQKAVCGMQIMTRACDAACDI